MQFYDKTAMNSGQIDKIQGIKLEKWLMSAGFIFRWIGSHGLKLIYQPVLRCQS